MLEKKTHALLLRKIPLSNDDSLLEFFTPFGKFLVFARKFQNSKKRAREVDFFRLLEIEFLESRTKKKFLKKAVAISFFHGFEGNYLATNSGFKWCERIEKAISGEKPIPEFFHKIVQIFARFDHKNFTKIDVFFRIKLLIFAGTFCKFDEIHKNLFFDKNHFRFFQKVATGERKFSKISREILEFCHHATPIEFFQKIDNFSDNNFEETRSILSEIENEFF